ncbi:hypothetical protein [Isoptericola croceus]|uniref:hypothetical protein n=1 Tax=Isoptericola croceus TaxID=3031406 RepID=UPI0023F622A7|nr:hypothetical protein [Isoptericola croceus]
MRTVARLTPIPLAVALAVSGCSTPTGGDAQEGVAAQSSSTDDAEPLGTIGVDFPDPDAVIADGTFTLPGTDDDVRIGITSLTVRGDVTELRLVFTPQYSTKPVSVFDMLGQASGGLDLIDREHLKEYRSGYTTDVVGAKAAQGESVGFQAFYAAPEDDITVIDVKVHDSWPVFEDVPLTIED